MAYSKLTNQSQNFGSYSIKVRQLSILKVVHQLNITCFPKHIEIAIQCWTPILQTVTHFIFNQDSGSLTKTITKH